MGVPRWESFSQSQLQPSPNYSESKCADAEKGAKSMTAMGWAAELRPDVSAASRLGATFHLERLLSLWVDDLSLAERLAHAKANSKSSD
jgi:hypothetical protein